MNEFELQAELREERGKGAARRLRRAGMIPAVLYGADKGVVSLKLDAVAVHKQLENEAFFSTILNIKVGSDGTQAVLKALQRDPASDRVVHVDLLRISSTQELTINVPLHFLNDEECPGKKAGGVTSHLVTDVTVSCLPQNLPEYIEVDMGMLDIGDALHFSDIKLPEGVTLKSWDGQADTDQPIVAVQHSQKFEEEEELAALEEGMEGIEGEEGAEPAEGEAPAGEAPEGEEGGEEGRGKGRDKGREKK
jgi:large subunit ribosomal protein L25